MKRNVLTAALCPLLALAVTACNSDSKTANNGGGGGDNCSEVIPMQVTGELAPMYSWSGGAVNSLTVARVENLEFIAENPLDCAPPGPVADECELAYVRSSLPDPSAPTVTRNAVESSVIHGSSPGMGTGVPSEIAVTEENPLENGVLYQASVIRALEDGTAACGCVRFNAGTSADDDDNCL